MILDSWVNEGEGNEVKEVLASCVGREERKEATIELKKEEVEMMVGKVAETSRMFEGEGEACHAAVLSEIGVALEDRV